MERAMQVVTIDINKAQKGDKEEFRLLFALFYPCLMFVACHFVAGSITGGIVQDVFVMYWEQKQLLAAVMILK